MTNKLETHLAWHDHAHAQHFDQWARLNKSGLRKIFEDFNEVRLFCQYKSQVKVKKILEVGCATGELYRYIKTFHPEFDYFGMDISEPAIERAKSKYPPEKFTICREEEWVSQEVKRLNIQPAVLFARDVVLHQTNPFEFLTDLISVPSEMAILRIRTRDKGETVLDPESSCQWHCNKWVPYMILNINDVIETIKKSRPVRHIHIIKSYIELGGSNGRYIPKDCYDPSTGTAETAVLIQVADKPQTPQITIDKQNDSQISLKPWDRKLSYLVGKVFQAAR